MIIKCKQISSMFRFVNSVHNTSRVDVTLGEFFCSLIVFVFLLFFLFFVAVVFKEKRVLQIGSQELTIILTAFPSFSEVFLVSSLA